MPIITTDKPSQPRKASDSWNNAKISNNSSALTDEDLENRRGCATGSGMSKLMTKSSRAGSWSNYTPEMICDFGKVATDYIFEKLMERKTGIVTRMKQTQEMRYGNEHEDDIFVPLASKLLKGKGIILEKCKFIKLPNQPNAGATPDGRGYKVGDGLKKSIIAIEIKCCLKAGTFLSRLETANTDSNIDYWQCITEMLALEVDELIYAIGHPPKSFSDPVPAFEMLHVKMSKIHANALSDRINLMDKIINDFIANNREYKDFKQSMLQSISEWRPVETVDKPTVAKEKNIKMEDYEEKPIEKDPLDLCAW